MKPLPRLLAFTDERIAGLDDLAQRAAALAAVGAAVGLVARRPQGSADNLADLARRFVALAKPPMASAYVTGRADIAGSCSADGVIARHGDLSVADMRTVLSHHAHDATGMVILRSVHSIAEAEEAVANGADGLIVGTIWPTVSHPARAGAGVELIDRTARCGVPVWAIGGVTPERALEARDAGAWGVASIGAAWTAADVNRAALDLLAPWTTMEEK